VNVPTPELDKMLAAKPESQPQGSLLEWLTERGYVICRLTTPYCSACEHAPWIDPVEPCPTCEASPCHRIGGDEYTPDSRSIEQLLAEYHGVDLVKAEEERMAVLEAVRAAGRQRLGLTPPEDGGE
jgi:hypothetical protein